ncbi:hypothetical protein [Actinoallomurus iriomotensis]|uniref:Uncharacterized protein n=1 Tax=Actinoallomurus iriomotensis TaxID=478107 RepID=A0A9W6VWK5_9ACTN|nr:hypothetical protein [Actinoallomurus iriomotensis]GLY82329.1 hypothetical protein Airi02_002610 [Actinoallomurus iriomotensis]
MTVDSSGSPPYVARFQRTAIALMILFGPGSAVVISVLTGVGVITVRQGVLLGLVVSIPALVTMGLGVARLFRSLRSGGVALAIDAHGIYFGAQPLDAPRRFSWDEISAIVLFSRRTEFVQGTVRCVGVRLHPCAAGSPERHLRDLDQALADSRLSAREREELNRLRDFDLETAVSFHIEVRGWRRRPAQLRKAMRRHAPGVPVIERRSDAYHELVGWRAARDLTERVRTTWP